MKIKKYIGGTLKSNGYVIYQQVEGKCYIIDPGYNPEKFINFVKENKLDLMGVILTHHHSDHIGGAEEIREAFNCQVMIHRADLDLYKNPIDVILEDGQKICLEDEELEIINTPGHTKGSICICSKKSKIVFTGDTIFSTDIGRTDLKDGSESEMNSSITNIIDKWPNDFMLYPGHGSECSMKSIRKNNHEFLTYINELKRD